MWAKIGGGFDQKMAISREIRKKIWWRRWDSNPRPQRCERCALPAELRPHSVSIGNGWGMANISLCVTPRNIKSNLKGIESFEPSTPALRTLCSPS